MRTLDAGTMGGDTGSWSFLLSMLAVTLGGIFVVCTLIGVLTSGIDEKLDELRKGRSRVARERPHRDPRLVAADLHDRLRAGPRQREPAPRRRRHPGRQGQGRDGGRDRASGCATPRPRDRLPHRQPDRPGRPARSSTSQALAPASSCCRRRRRPRHRGHQDDPGDHQQPAAAGPSRTTSSPRSAIRRTSRSRGMVGRDEAELVLVADDLIARIDRADLPAVRPVGRLHGAARLRRRRDLLQERTGADRADLRRGAPRPTRTRRSSACARHAGIRLNPPMDTRDRRRTTGSSRSPRTTTRVVSPPSRRIEADAIVDARRRTARRPAHARPERTLILGWNLSAADRPARARSLRRAGSELTIVAAFPERHDRSFDGLPQPATGSGGASSTGDTTDRARSTRLDVATLRSRHRAQSPRRHGHEDAAGRRPHAGHAAPPARHRRTRRPPFSIVSEMLDMRNRDLAEVTRADDFIVSDRLVSLLLTQIAENQDLTAVFADLFDAEGSELYLKPAADYVRLGRVELLHRRRERPPPRRGRHRLSAAAPRQRPGSILRSRHEPRQVGPRRIWRGRFGDRPRRRLIAIRPRVARDLDCERGEGRGRFGDRPRRRLIANGSARRRGRVWWLASRHRGRRRSRAAG